MWRLLRVFTFVLATAGWSMAQEQTTNPEELQRKYQDVVSQLNAAQDRKNQLATENEKLTARVADLEKQLADARQRESTFKDQTWRLRSQAAAWETFLKRYPLLLERWRSFLESSPLAVPSSLPEMADPTKPLGG